MISTCAISHSEAIISLSSSINISVLQKSQCVKGSLSPQDGFNINPLKMNSKYIFQIWGISHFVSEGVSFHLKRQMSHFGGKPKLNINFMFGFREMNELNLNFAV